MTASVGLWIGREFLENLTCLLYYLFVDLFLACGLGIEEEFIRGYRLTRNRRYYPIHWRG